MPKKKGNISTEMQRCIDALKEHGKLIRYAGGFWSAENVEWKKKWDRVAHCYTDENEFPLWSYSWGAIQALLNRNLIEITSHKQGKYGSFPIEVRLVNVIPKAV